MKIVRSNRKTIALVIEEDGSLTVRAPHGASRAFIEKFVREKRDWVQSRQERAARTYQPPHRFEEGELFYYLGKSLPLKYTDHQSAPLTLNEAFFIDRRLKEQAGRVFLNWYKRQARLVIEERATTLADRYHYRFNRLRISSARTRWGSCSSRGTLSFTWRLVMSPPEVIDYVVVHELAHLRIPNHSREFWASVEALMPEYTRYRDWLKKNGSKLKL